MAIPDYQTLMLPLLQYAGDQKDHSLRQAIDALVDQFHVTDEERKTLLPSGQQAVLDNRVGWARTYMKKAGLLESPKRGILRIMSRGLEVLASKPSMIDARFLTQFPELVAFQSLKSEDPQQLEADREDTPEEVLENAFLTLRRNLAADILAQIKSSPLFVREDCRRTARANGLRRYTQGCRPSCREIR
jgi:restriction system protein